MTGVDLILSKYSYPDKLSIFRAFDLVIDNKYTIEKALESVGIEMEQNDRRVCEMEIIRNNGELQIL